MDRKALGQKTDGQKGRRTNRQMDRKTDGQKDIGTERQMHSWTEGQAGGQKDRWIER